MEPEQKVKTREQSLKEKSKDQKEISIILWCGLMTDQQIVFEPWMKDLSKLLTIDRPIKLSVLNQPPIESTLGESAIKMMLGLGYLGAVEVLLLAGLKGPPFLNWADTEEAKTLLLQYP